MRSVNRRWGFRFQKRGLQYETHESGSMAEAPLPADRLWKDLGREGNEASAAISVSVCSVGITSPTSCSLAAVRVTVLFGVCRGGRRWSAPCSLAASGKLRELQAKKNANFFHELRTNNFRRPMDIAILLPRLHVTIMMMNHL